ncbi:GNAT family N-acetyltransferase [Corallincola spongiicola]|uniref:GNAT family N-acetyltransferase n=1 Tax=Corallincola spongiicola TaxID=2520508 RepID=A0ABY1WPZ4_9GAMM|nr:GNAT family N-acetyltransferase [Corallincola spongiicola]
MVSPWNLACCFKVGNAIVTPEALSAEPLVVEKLTPSQFQSLQAEWSELLANSHGNALFLSWAWVWSWWSTWSKLLNLELYLVCVRDQQGKLLGLAPLYRHQVNYAGLTIVTRLQCIGNAWKLAPTVRSEYIGFIAECEHELVVYQAIWQFLQSQQDWDELILCDMDKSSRSFRIMSALARMHSCHLHPASIDFGIRVPVSGDFSSYLKSLGRNTRLKLVNRRSRLAELGPIEHERVSKDKYATFFQQLNQLHATRWGKGCYVGASERFHLQMLSYLPSESAHCLLLRQRGEVISALYDLELGGVRYNLQAGYLQDHHPKVSLGTLHLGYGLEQAWQTPDCQGYDLLAGGGKHSFYKQHLGKARTPFVTLQIIRASKAWRLYPLIEKLPSKWRQWLKRSK